MLHTGNRSEKSEGGAEELSEGHRQYLEDERAGMQTDNPDLELAPPASALFEDL